MPVRRVLVLFLAAVVCTGCIQVKETIRLNKEGSGTVHMMVTFPQLGLRWLPGIARNWMEVDPARVIGEEFKPFSLLG